MSKPAEFTAVEINHLAETGHLRNWGMEGGPLWHDLHPLAAVQWRAALGLLALAPEPDGSGSPFIKRILVWTGERTRRGGIPRGNRGVMSRDMPSESVG